MSFLSKSTKKIEIWTKTKRFLSKSMVKILDLDKNWNYLNDYFGLELLESNRVFISFERFQKNPYFCRLFEIHL